MTATLPGTPIIELDRVSRTFGTRRGDGRGETRIAAVRPTSLTIARGEVFGLIGSSGAGKSTLLRLINLLERPDAGRVIVAGRELTALSRRDLRVARRGIGMIFQSFNLLANATVFDNVAFPLTIQSPRPSKDSVRTRVAECLALVGLAARGDAYPAQLSGGQRQRVAIARALASGPDVLLCDEPTSSLDSETTKSLLETLADINRRQGVTIVIVTHELSVAKALCDRVAVVADGRIAETIALDAETGRGFEPLETAIARTRTVEAEPVPPARDVPGLIIDPMLLQERPMPDLQNLIALGPEIAVAIGQTALMLAIGIASAIVVGGPLGILLFLTSPSQSLANTGVFRVASWIVNTVRSFPFIILLVALVPITRVIAGTSIGPVAAAVPLSIAAIPYFARLVEQTLREVPRGVIEAAHAMGASELQIVVRVLIREGRAGLVSALTVLAISFLSYSAVAGVVGGGGIGDLAIRYGYYRFQTDVMVAMVLLLVVIVQLIQWSGNALARRLDRR